MNWGKYLDSDECFFSECPSWLLILTVAWWTVKSIWRGLDLIWWNCVLKWLKLYDVINFIDINRIIWFSFGECKGDIQDVCKIYFIWNFPVLLLFSLCSVIQNFRWISCWQGKNIYHLHNYYSFLYSELQFFHWKTRRPMWRPFQILEPAHVCVLI